MAIPLHSRQYNCPRYENTNEVSEQSEDIDYESEEPAYLL